MSALFGSRRLLTMPAEVEARTKSEVNADPSKFLLTPDEMVDNDYRLPSYMSATGSGTSRNHNNINLNGKGKEREDEWVETPQRVGEGDWRVLAIDCEMVSSVFLVPWLLVSKCFSGYFAVTELG